MMEKICERCHNITGVFIMSMFDTSNICLDCKKKEEKHPEYERAILEESNSIRNGNYNFKGIGLPKDL